MPDHYQQAYRVAERLIHSGKRQYICAYHDAREFGMSVAALTRRLDWLEQYGWLKSRQVGKQRRFRLT